MEAVFLAQHDQKLEVIEAAHGKSRLPCAAQVDDKAAVVLQNAMKLFRKGAEPVKIGILLLVAVILLAGQREGWTGQDQVDGRLLATLHHVQAVGVIDAPVDGFRGRRLEVLFPVILFNPLNVQFLEVHSVPRLALKGANDGRRAFANRLEVVAVEHDKREIGVSHDLVGVTARFAANVACRDDDDHIAFEKMRQADFLGHVVERDAGRVLALNLPAGKTPRRALSKMRSTSAPPVWFARRRVAT